MKQSIPIFRGVEKDVDLFAQEVPYHGYDGLGDWEHRKHDEDDKPDVVKEEKG